MVPLTLYLDTSVTGGYFDEEFRDATRRLWELAEEGRFSLITSTVVARELVLAPERVVELFRDTFAQTHLLPISPPATELASAYINEGVCPRGIGMMRSMLPWQRRMTSSSS